ncbi:TAXI family TRAP transporter solute-binding subunit [Streptomyces sp. NPDC006012]|uniref:TAXI family TRAP transporter solute-binding subunit n=1 Tax=Streptomyces sp. NPDC006012 TaxID=3364739 RepID=UPI0036A9A96B
MSKLLPRLGRRRAFQVAAVGAVALALLAWWLLPLGESPPTGTIVFSTGTKRGVYQEYGQRLRSELDKDMPGLTVKLLSSAGSQENVQRVATGEADFTIAAADAVETYRLRNGPGARDLRGVARLYDDYMQLIVARDSDVHSVADLRHKRVAIGPVDSGVRLIADRILRAAGIDPVKDITPLADGIDNGPDQLSEGHIDAFFWSGGLPTKGLSEVARTFAIRFIPMGTDLVAKLRGQGDVTRYYRTTSMPESAYPSAEQSAPVPTIAVSNLLITRKDLDPKLTEWLTRTVIKSRDDIGSHVHSAQLVDLRTAIYTDPLALHEGARRYYRSVKP